MRVFTKMLDKIWESMITYLLISGYQKVYLLINIMHERICMSNGLPKAIIFGTGSSGQKVLPLAQQQYQVVAFVDNDKKRWGQTIEGLLIYSPDKILEIEYEMIIIASLPGLEPITEQLLNMGVKRGNINNEYVALSVKSRIVFLEKLAELFTDKNIAGCVAEGGVFQGEFAKEINRIFPSSKFYLFDTFSGFDEKDVLVERKFQYSEFGTGHLNITNEDLVISKLINPDVCFIRRGYFPETTEGIDEKFCFVNLDFDLYNPTLAGLEYFIPRMVTGGVILIHDYFTDGYKGVKEAINRYTEKNKKLQLFPIGDGFSIGIQC